MFQVYKLEKEHKRLEADAAVYNLLQEQLKLSPAYKTVQPSSFLCSVYQKTPNTYAQKHTHPHTLKFRPENKFCCLCC